MIPLTELESDILGDMAWDSHGVGEIVGLIRSANPLYADAEIYRDLLELLTSWIDRGWLSVVAQPAHELPVASIADLLPYLERHGISAVSLDSAVPLPEIDLTRQAFVDVEWLRAVQ
ncbi:MAG TPA: hypothetical protein VN650_01190 [Gemmatimonadaceae bacterium]|jgi:hypothetical protein|nr:hypothetical protein [Gemmatimonadaceae bacterium]